MSTIYITTSIPYVNSRPHIGHALELIQADVLARYYRLTGHSVVFQTGTDENAFKNVLAARAQGIPPQTLVDRNAAVFRSLVERLNISADVFIRTTEDRHRQGVLEFWEQLNPKDLFIQRYQGLYCHGCEDFYLERDLVQGVCSDHGIPPQPIEEENIFFRLSSYKTRLHDLIASDRLRIVPEKRKNEVLSFIRRGLQDISITRSCERAEGWGIPVPGNPSQVIYVWIDALINYVTGQGFGTGGTWRQVWSQDTRKIHVIGKIVWKFHALYWPALLLSAGLPLPDEILIHGFLTENGRKISKSLGNGVDPFDAADRIGVDGLRHFLLKAISPIEDGDFSLQRAEAVYECDLANGLGNLLSRLTSLCEKSGYGRFSPSAPALDRLLPDLREFRLDDAASIVWNRVSQLNQEIARSKPWELLNRNEAAALKPLLAGWLRQLHELAIWLEPFLPQTGTSVIEALSGDEVRAVKPLFPRIR